MKLRMKYLAVMVAAFALGAAAQATGASALEQECALREPGRYIEYTWGPKARSLTAVGNVLSTKLGEVSLAYPQPDSEQSPGLPGGMIWLSLSGPGGFWTGLTHQIGIEASAPVTLRIVQRYLQSGTYKETVTREPFGEGVCYNQPQLVGEAVVP